MATKIDHRPHYTVRDFEQWKGRWELIEGMPYAMTPLPSIRHQEISGNIAFLLTEALEGCGPCRSLLPVDWKLSEDTVLEPDNLVVCGEVSGQYLTEPPVLIFEILSPSTSDKDRTVKRALYEAEGVRHFVLVDPEAETAEVLEFRNGRYEKRAEAHSGTVGFDLGECEITLDIGRFWS